MLTVKWILLCALALGGAPQEWQRVMPGMTSSFPRDHGAHPGYRIEWWYITGQLESNEGRRFGFQFTIFRRGLGDAPNPQTGSKLRASQVLAGHLAITDVKNQRTVYAERLRRMGSPLATASERDLNLHLEDWSLNRTEDGRIELRAADAPSGLKLQLELKPRKPLVLHGDAGYSSKGADPGNASAYHSWTRLGSSGEIGIDDQTFATRGEAWFDHEYGSSVLEEGVSGWDWFGLHLEDGRDLMLFQLRRKDGTRAPASAGSLIAADGSVTSLRAKDFTIKSRETWVSPATGARYPAAWSLEIPMADLSIDIQPLVPDCELGTTQSTGVAYWEGPVAISGSAQGRGYAELTGYAGSMEGRF